MQGGLDINNNYTYLQPEIAISFTVSYFVFHFCHHPHREEKSIKYRLIPCPQIL